MRSLALAIGIAGLLLAAGPACAQWQYTDAKGTIRVSQYRLYVPADLRDEAVWIGPTGIGKPALSEAQRELRRRDEAYRRIRDSEVWRISPFRK
jgi:hypothetical protein